jgi:hypothetical protein
MQKVETKLGNVWVIPTHGNHIFVSFGKNLNVDEEGPENGKRHGPLILRGVIYAGSAHFYLWKDGSWNIGEEGKTSYERRCSLYLSKYGRSYKESDPSESARDTIAGVLIEAVQEWTVNNSSEIESAENRHTQEEIFWYEEKIALLREEIAKLEREITKLQTGR